MAVHKKTMRKDGDPTSEQVTNQRALHLWESGVKCAKMAKSRRLTSEHSRGYIYLFGDNNTAEFMKGWNEEWEK